MSEHKLCEKCFKEKDDCKDREYLCDSKDLKIKLATINSECKCCSKPKEKTHDECKYKHYSYNGSFHKTLKHKTSTGHLDDSDDYRHMVHDILENKQKHLNNIPLASGSVMKLVDPLASLSSVLVGKDQCCFNVPCPPRLSCSSGAAEMVELYCKVLARDIPFVNYSTDSTITNIINYMNAPKVLSSLPDYSPANVINTANLFRGKFIGDQFGPYVSQLLYYNVPMGSLKLEQKSKVPPSVATAIAAGTYTVEWGRNNTETITIQNGQINTLPAGPTPSDLITKYINDGRTLAEVVHNDPIYTLYHNAALILQGLGIQQNPDFPSYINQVSFLTNGGGASILCALAEASDLAIKHCWFWKWQVYRKLRPEAFGLWIDNIKNNRVSNNDNYDISSTVLTNPVMNAIMTHNAQWGSGFTSSYTLPHAYKEGSPAHPAYPSGHAAIAGACATILKIYFDCEQAWSNLNGLKPSSFNSNIVPSPVNTPFAESNASGSALQNYTGSDASSMTVYGEINKLASNIAFGRNWAGIHYRTDAVQGMLLGEQVAISYMQDKLSSWVQNYLSGSEPKIKFRKFDNSVHTIKPTLCVKCKKHSCKDC